MCSFFKGTETLSFTPTTVISGEQVIVTCGPPPENLNLASLTAVWTRDGNPITKDSLHTLSINNGQARLTVSKAFDTDSGKKSFGSVSLQSMGELYIIYTFTIQVLSRTLPLVL